MAQELTVIPQAVAHLATQPQTLDKITNVQRIGGLLAASGYFQDARDMAQAAVKVMAGEELGIAPIAAMMGIHIIKGKVSLSGNLIAALVRKSGYKFKHLKFTATECELEFSDKAGAVLGVSSFTDADARKAKVWNEMYDKFPRNMLYNRAISNGAKWFCPEVTCGIPVYIPEELGAEVNEDGDYLADTPNSETKPKASTQEVTAKPDPAPSSNSRTAQVLAAAAKFTTYGVVELDRFLDGLASVDFDLIQKSGKLPELKTAAETATAAARPVIGNDDVPRNMGGTYDPPETVAVDSKEAARVKLAEPILPKCGYPNGYEFPWKTAKPMMEAYSAIKGRLESEGAYYSELALYGAEHANDFLKMPDGATKAKACYYRLTKLAGPKTQERAA